MLTLEVSLLESCETASSPNALYLGTNTDAVVLRPLVDDDLNTRDDPVVAWAKTMTTPDVTSGIEEALKNVLRNGKISPKDVHFVSIGTTVRCNIYS